GPLTWSGGTMDGASSTGLTKILASATLNQTISTTAANGRTIEVDGLYDLSSASTTTVFASGTAALIHVVSGGTLRRSGNGTASINVPVQNDGTVITTAGNMSVLHPRCDLVGSRLLG